MKKMTIEEKIAYLEALKRVIEDARTAQDWWTVYDSEKEEYTTPTKDDDNFNRWNAYNVLIAQLEAMI